MDLYNLWRWFRIFVDLRTWMGTLGTPLNNLYWQVSTAKSAQIRNTMVPTPLNILSLWMSYFNNSIQFSWQNWRIGPVVETRKIKSFYWNWTVWNLPIYVKFRNKKDYSVNKSVGVHVYNLWLSTNFILYYFRYRMLRPSTGLFHPAVSWLAAMLRNGSLTNGDFFLWVFQGLWSEMKKPIIGKSGISDQNPWIQILDYRIRIRILPFNHRLSENDIKICHCLDKNGFVMCI